MRLSLTLGLAALLSVASLHAARGLQFNHHANLGHDSSGSTIKEAFVAAFNDNDPAGQVIGLNTFTPLSFPTNQTGPVNIVHPFSDDSQFSFQLGGRYLIGWTLTINSVGAGISPPTVTVQLFNTSTLSAIGPSPFQIHKADRNFDNLQSVSGQTIVKLAAGTVLQLRAMSNTTGVAINDPTLFIARIDD